MAAMPELSAVQRDFLSLLISREALRFGDFTLKSGRRSPYFINTGSFHQGGDLARIGRCYAAVIAQHLGEVQVVFGPAYKGIPLALAAAQALEEPLGRPVGWCYDRKEVKDHGDGGAFVGAPLEPGTRVVVVDDVLTAGTALRESLAKLGPTGVTILGAVISVDRQERGQGEATAAEEIAADHGVPVLPIITISQAVDHLAEHEVEGLRLEPERAAEIRQHLAGARA